MQNWTAFFGTVAAAAATLLGLLFVAISITAAETLGSGQEDSRRLAEQGFQNYFVILIVTLVALLPDMTISTLGLVAISATILGSIWVLIRFGQSLRDARHLRGRVSSVRRHAVSVLGFAMLIYSALRMRSSDPGSATMDIFASALIVLLSSATLASWELLLRISRFRAPR